MSTCADCGNDREIIGPFAAKIVDGMVHKEKYFCKRCPRGDQALDKFMGGE